MFWLFCLANTYLGKMNLQPAEGSGDTSVYWGFYFKIHPTGAHAANHDGLENTQEADGTN